MNLQLSSIKKFGFPYSDSEMGIIDYCVFTVIALLCFLSFNQNDISLTLTHAAMLLRGESPYSVPPYPNYMPTTYLIFALWEIPLKIVGLLPENIMQGAQLPVLMWGKLGMVLFYMGSGYLVYKIAGLLNFDKIKAKLCTIIFLTCPIGFFSQFIFGQYDILTVFFMLFGIYFYFKNALVRSSLLFGVAITCKYFALPIFVIFILLRVKQIPKIIYYGLIGIIPMALILVTCIWMPGFRAGVLGFGATSYITISGIHIFGKMSLQLIPFFFVVLCAFAYFKNTESEDELAKWVFYLCTMTIFLCFGLSMFHPQWLLFAVPFWIFGTCINKNYKTFLIIDILMMLFFTIFTVRSFPYNVDAAMFSRGIFQNIRTLPLAPLMRDILLFPVTMSYAILSALMLINGIFKHPKFCFEKLSQPISDAVGLIRSRFLLGVGLFVVPAFVCLFLCLNLPPILTDLSFSNEQYTTPITQGRVFSAVTKVNGSSIATVEPFIATYARDNTSSLNFSIIDTGNGTTLFDTVLNTAAMRDDSFYKIKTPNIPINPDTLYEFRFTSVDGTPDNAVTIYTTGEGTDWITDTCYGMIDGERQNFSFRLRITGSE